MLFISHLIPISIIGGTAAITCTVIDTLTFLVSFLDWNININNGYYLGPRWR